MTLNFKYGIELNFMVNLEIHSSRLRKIYFFFNFTSERKMSATEYCTILFHMNIHEHMSIYEKRLPSDQL